MAALVSIVAILVIPLIFVAGLIVTGLNLGVLVAVVAVLGTVLTGGLSARAVAAKENRSRTIRTATGH